MKATLPSESYMMNLFVSDMGVSGLLPTHMLPDDLLTCNQNKIATVKVLDILHQTWQKTYLTSPSLLSQEWQIA